MRLDLHVHTRASDGAWSPEAVVEGAVEGGLDVVAITDHDTTDAVAPAIAAAAGRRLEVVPGTELSSTWENRELHVLGYFVDPDAPALVEHRRRARSLRRRRMERMIHRLETQGVHVTMESVLRAAGPDTSVLARPHLARALVEAGHVATVPEAFNRYLADQHPAFVPTALQTPAEAIQVILESGGIPVWAHPPLEILESLLPELVDAGLRGLELLRPRTSPTALDRLRGAARREGLLVTGGSDWHDPDRNEPLGSFWVTADEVAAFLDEGGM